MSEDWVEGRRARGVKEIQVFWKEIQVGGNKFQIGRNEIQLKSPQFPRRIGLFQQLTPTPWPFFFLRRFHLEGGHAQSVACHSRPPQSGRPGSHKPPPLDARFPVRPAPGS